MAKVRVVIEAEKESLQLLTSAHVHILDEAMLNETKIAEALRSLADNIEHGSLFQPVKVLTQVPFAAEWK